MKPTVWLVGASTGIGASLVEEWAREAGHLFISARSADKLEAIAAGRESITVVPFDITDEQGRSDAIEQVTAAGHGLDWLVINAGTCEYVDLEKEDPEPALYDRVIGTNFLGPVKLAHAALPLLRRSKAARLVGISSSVTFTPLPRSQAYGASKAAFTYWLGTMAADLGGEGIRVQVVSPGFVDTPLTRRNDFSMPFLVSSESAARRIARGVRRNRTHISFPRRFTIWLQLIGRLPLAWQYALNKKLSRNTQPHVSEGK